MNNLKQENKHQTTYNNNKKNKILRSKLNQGSKDMFSEIVQKEKKIKKHMQKLKDIPCS